LTQFRPDHHKIARLEGILVVGDQRVVGERGGDVVLQRRRRVLVFTPFVFFVVAVADVAVDLLDAGSLRRRRDQISFLL
jgi:hypothetical protein